MSEWKEYGLHEIASFSQGKQIPVSEQFENKLLELDRFIRIVDFTSDWTQPPRYVKKDDKYKVGKNDIVMLRYGTPGKVFRGHEGIIANNMFKISPDESIVTKEYLYWFLYQDSVYKILMANQSSSTMPAISFKMLSCINVKVPSFETQQHISSFFDTLDEKNAVNKKICENLEAQAQALFKHWFVDFTPFNDGKFVESELGMIPLSLVCEQITDGVHNSVKDEPNSSYMLLSCKNIVGGVLSKNNYRSISKNTFDSLRLRTKLAKGDILISSVGTIGEIAIVEEDPLNYEFQRSVAIVKPKEKIGTYFLYNALLASKTRLQHAAHGAVQQCLFIGDLKKFKVNCYDIEKAFLYNETVKPLFEEIAKLHQESDRLSSLRDTLLPKLMSGQIKINEIEKSL